MDILLETDVESSGAQCALSFDPTVVHCTGVTGGSFYVDNVPAGTTVMWLGLPATIDNAAGTVANFGVVCLPSTAGAIGSGVLATLQFTAVGTGVSPLEFTSGQAAGTGASPSSIATTLIGGELKVGQACSSPDLTVTHLDCEWASSGSSYRVTYRITNEGSTASEPCSVAVKVNGTTEATVTCPAIQPSQTHAGQAGPFGLGTGDTVTVQVCADSSGIVSESNEGNNCRSLEWPGLPNSPSGLTASCDSSGTVELTWKDNSDDEEGFRVQRSTRSTFPDEEDQTEAFDVDANVKTYKDTDTPAGRTLYYRVVAFNDNGESPPSDSVSVKTPTQMERLVAPNPPTSLAVTMVDGRNVYLQWVDNSTSEDRFRIERSTAEDFKENVRQFSGSANDFRYTDTTSELGKTYFYRIFAGNMKGDSTPSNTVSVTLLKAPKDLAIEVLGPNQVNLSWSDSVENEEGFRIERSVDPNFVNKAVSYTVAAGVTRFGDIGVEPATTYYYRVRAYAAGYDSVSSNVVSATPLDAIEKVIAPAVQLDRVVDMRGMFPSDFVCTRLEGVRQLSVARGTLIRDRAGHLVLELTSRPLDYPVLAPTKSNLLNLPRHYHPFGLTYLPAVTVVTEQECRLVGGMVSIGPDGTRFSQPVALSLQYDPALLPAGCEEEDLCISWYNPESDRWVELPSVCVPAEHTVTAWVSHFSVFAVVAPGNAAVPWQQIAVVFIIEVFAGILALLVVTTRRRAIPVHPPQAAGRFAALPERAGGEPIT